MNLPPWLQKWGPLAGAVLFSCMLVAGAFVIGEGLYTEKGSPYDVPLPPPPDPIGAYDPIDPPPDMMPTQPVKVDPGVAKAKILEKCSNEYSYMLAADYHSEDYWGSGEMANACLALLRGEAKVDGLWIPKETVDNAWYDNPLGQGIAEFKRPGRNPLLVMLWAQPTPGWDPSNNYFDINFSDLEEIEGMVDVTNASISAGLPGESPEDPAHFPALATIEGIDSSGLQKTVYLKMEGMKHGGVDLFFARRNASGQLETRIEDRQSGLSFYIPLEFDAASFWYNFAARDPMIEDSLHKNPIYHSEACGAEPSYSDLAAYIGTRADAENALLEINISTSSILYLTTPKAGYVPSQWGTIMGQISRAEFIQRAKTEYTQYPGRSVEFVTLAGMPVKHILPHAPVRSCNGDEGEVAIDQYQAVHPSGAVLTFTMRNFDYSRYGGPAPVPSTAAERQAWIAQVLSTFALNR